MGTDCGTSCFSLERKKRQQLIKQRTTDLGFAPLPISPVTGDISYPWSWEPQDRERRGSICSHGAICVGTCSISGVNPGAPRRFGSPHFQNWRGFRACWDHRARGQTEQPRNGTQTPAVAVSARPGAAPGPPLVPPTHSQRGPQPERTARRTPQMVTLTRSLLRKEPRGTGSGFLWVHLGPSF